MRRGDDTDFTRAHAPLMAVGGMHEEGLRRAGVQCQVADGQRVWALGISASPWREVHCVWQTSEEALAGSRRKRKSADTDTAAEPKVGEDILDFQKHAAEVERVKVQGGPGYGWAATVFKPWRMHAVMMDAIATAMASKLIVLRLDDFPGRGDPVFGTRREIRMSAQAAAHDLFGCLAMAFRSGGNCALKRLTLQSGFMSAEALIHFLGAAKPSLESFRARGCLFHGRNYRPLVAALQKCSPGLVEFETDAYIGGSDPLGVLADAFPKLQMLRVSRMYGEVPQGEALKRMKCLRRDLCKFAREDQALYGNFAISENGHVTMFLTSEHHDDNYRGEGLWWDELENLAECAEQWTVGRGVTEDMLRDFMEECGIWRRESINVTAQDDGPTEVEEIDTIIVQVCIQKSGPGSQHSITATNLTGQMIAELSGLELATATVGQLLDELVQKCKYDPLSVQLVLPDGSSVQAATHRFRTFEGLLK